jgi:hypothetical protein
MLPPRGGVPCAAARCLIEGFNYWRSKKFVIPMGFWSGSFEGSSPRRKDARGLPLPTSFSSWREGWIMWCIARALLTLDPKPVSL